LPLQHLILFIYVPWGGDCGVENFVSGNSKPDDYPN